MSKTEKTHTTNYYDAFIEVAEDCPAAHGELPKAKGDTKTAAEIQYAMIPCPRASPLTKRNGFGIHADDHGKVALYGVDTREYQGFVKNPKVKKVKAMRTSKK